MNRNLVGSKTVSHEDMAPILEKMKDHLIGKNVAAEIAVKLCESVAAKLDGKVNQKVSYHLTTTFRLLTNINFFFRCWVHLRVWQAQ